MTRSIAVVTTTRADLWPLLPVIEALGERDDVYVWLAATGTHLSDAFGRTLSEVPAGIEVERIPCEVASTDPQSLVAATASMAVGLGACFERRRPDLLVVLGDRYELLGIMTAATLHQIPVAHLHGGEVTEGALDDSVRHAVTKLSHLHLCANEAYGARIRQLGEEPWRVHVTGAPALDRLPAAVDAHPLAEVEALLGQTLSHPAGLLTYHPPTMTPQALDLELDALLAAAERLPTVIATYPGADPGAERIIARLEQWQASRPGAHLIRSLGPLFPRTMASVDVVLGNSSSGIYEAPALGVPAINVGERQTGRVRSRAVIDVDAAGVGAALEQALDPAFRAEVAGGSSVLGDGHAAPRIAAVLAEAPLDRLLVKHFVDGPVA